MREGLKTLSGREKETLRLLLGGHDAKSIARELGLSVHTINERLREARRKMGVSSSREAARLLAEVERNSPEFLADKQLRGAAGASAASRHGQPDRGKRPYRPFVWAIGGMVFMLLIITAAALFVGGHVTGTLALSGARTEAAGRAVSRPTPDTSENAARRWLALVDQSRWHESWNAAGPLIRGQVSEESWTAIVRPVRAPLGVVTSRTLQGVVRASTLPGAPPGDYSVLQFRTRFAHKPDSVETVTLAREGSSWKVSGYFIR
jgi:DNA-binding CsgD family transcriptional regulator